MFINLFISTTLLFIGIVSVIPLHELGHYIAIRFFKGIVFEVNLSKGTPILKLGKFNLGLNFFNGNVDWDEKTIKSSKKKALISLAGPLVNLLVYFDMFKCYSI